MESDEISYHDAYVRFERLMFGDAAPIEKLTAREERIWYAGDGRVRHPLEYQNIADKLGQINDQLRERDREFNRWLVHKCLLADE
jgi:hypothetical protein